MKPRLLRVSSLAAILAFGLLVPALLASDASLINAISAGNLEEVRSLIDKGADFKQPFAGGQTPLHFAIGLRKTGIAKLLIERGADVNATDSSNKTRPIHLALVLGADSGLISALLKKGADVNAVDAGGLTPLQQGLIFNKKHDVVKLLIDHGANVNFKDAQGNRAIHSAISFGLDAPLVAEMIGKGADINAVGAGGLTALALALTVKKHDIAKLLIDRGADVNTKDDQAMRPLHYAVFAGTDTGLVAALIEKGADVNAKADKHAFSMMKVKDLTALRCAMWMGRSEIAKILVEKGADVGSADKPLLQAVLAGDEKGVQARLAQGAKPEDGSPPPLFFAALTGNSKLAAALLAAGARLDSSWSELRPIHVAAAAGHSGVVKLFLERGADWKAKTGKSSAFDYAIGSGQADTASIFIERGADVNAPGPGGQTPLLSAIYGDHLQLTRLLIKKGADLKAVKGGQAPLSFALMFGRVEMVNLLLEKGADLAGRGNELLQGAAIHGRADWVKIMLDHNVDVDPGVAKLYAQMAKDASHPEVAELLAEAWPDAETATRLRAERAAKAELAAKLPKIEAAEKAGDGAAKAGRAQNALTSYAEALQLCPPGSEHETRIRKKAIALARRTRDLPVPKEAERRLTRAHAFIERATNADGFRPAVAELEQATRIAPWLAEGYYNLGLVQEKVGDYAGAISNLKLYLEFAPGSEDAEAVKNKIYKLEVDKELADQKR